MTSIAPTSSARVEQEPFDAVLRRRAKRVIPGGMWGHMNAARLPGGLSAVLRPRAGGCRLWDVDGRRIRRLHVQLRADHPRLQRSGRRGGGRAPARARRLHERPGRRAGRAGRAAGRRPSPHADWAMFAKNGTDATTTCVTIARAGTGRRKVLVARGSYHGAVPWCTPSLAGVTAEDRAHLLHFDYNDVASLEAAVDEAGDDLAAILVTAFRHDVRRDQELPTAGVRASGPRALRRRRCGADRRRRPRRLPPPSRRQLGAARRAAGPVGLEQGDRQRPRAGRGHRQRPLPAGGAARSS